MKDFIVEKIRKKQEVIIFTLLALGGMLFVYYAMSHEQRFFGDGEPEEANGPQQVRLLSQENRVVDSGQEDQARKTNFSQQMARSTSYFLQPSPAEVMKMVRQIVDSELPVPKKSYNQLRIVWPVYYSQQISQEQKTVTVQFDTSQDGFGINVVTAIDALKYPEILVAKPYQKMWLAGTVTAIDAVGTGTIYMDAEQVRFQEELLEVQRKDSHE